ncbi:MAG: hypothetical protein ACRD3L_06780 [Terriglobales bacterium]
MLKSIAVVPLMLVVCASVVAQSNVVCTADVPPATCKLYSVNMDWSEFVWVKNVEVVVADPKSFKDEDKKLTQLIDNRGKAAKTVGDINRAGNLKVGEGVFANILMETDGGLVKKVVISTDRHAVIKGGDGKDIILPDDGDIEKLSDELLFYLLGYAQGHLRGMASTLP